jgi:hypothetical protein
MEPELGWREAIISVLTAANAPMHYAEIAEQIFERGLRTGQTATPAATVRSTLTQSFKNDGDRSPFIRISAGVYALRTNGRTLAHAFENLNTNPPNRHLGKVNQWFRIGLKFC